MWSRVCGSIWPAWRARRNHLLNGQLPVALSVPLPRMTVLPYPWNQVRQRSRWRKEPWISWWMSIFCIMNTSWRVSRSRMSARIWTLMTGMMWDWILPNRRVWLRFIGGLDMEGRRCQKRQGYQVFFFRRDGWQIALSGHWLIDSLIDWLIPWFLACWIDSLIDWLIGFFGFFDWLFYGPSFGRVIDRWIFLWFFDRSSYRLIAWLQSLIFLTSLFLFCRIFSYWIFRHRNVKTAGDTRIIHANPDYRAGVSHSLHIQPHTHPVILHGLLARPHHPRSTRGKFTPPHRSPPIKAPPRATTRIHRLSPARSPQPPRESRRFEPPGHPLQRRHVFRAGRRRFRRDGRRTRQKIFPRSSSPPAETGGEFGTNGWRAAVGVVPAGAGRRRRGPDEDAGDNFADQFEEGWCGGALGGMSAADYSQCLAGEAAGNGAAVAHHHFAAWGRGGAGQSAASAV